MNIALNIEIGNTEIKNFSELEREFFNIALGVGRQLMQQVLEKLDDELLADRDVSRYRNKGFQQTCIKTKLRAVEYKRRVYVDNAAPENTRCVHLLDEALNMEKVGLVSSEVCQIAATAVCETSYRGAAGLISETTGLGISAQGVWDIIQKLGESQVSQIQRHAELAQLHKGAGALVTKLLYNGCRHNSNTDVRAGARWYYIPKQAGTGYPGAVYRTSGDCCHCCSSYGRP